MSDYDRTLIDTSLARRLVDGQFPQWSDLPIREVELDGWDNRTFRLGSELSVRLPTGSWYAKQVEKEQRWLPVLAPHLPLPIPAPVARGEPGAGYPFAWSVYRWLDGEPAASATITDLTGFAAALAGFLRALGQVDATGGPEPGEHNFFRGGPLGTYAGEALDAVEALGDEIPRDDVLRVWEDAMATSWDGEPVWFHGDVAVGTCSSATGGSRGCSTSAPPASAIPPATWSSPGRSCQARAATASARSSRWTRAPGRPRLGALEGAHHPGRRA